MKALKAEIELKNDVLTFPEMDLIELAHILIKYAQPKLEIKITDERKKQFCYDAAKAFVASKTSWDAVEFTKLYVEMKCSEYIRLEHAKHSYNELVLSMIPARSEISDSEMLDIQNKALEFVKEKISENNWDLIYDLKRENLKNQLIISKLVQTNKQ